MNAYQNAPHGMHKIMRHLASSPSVGFVEL